jgi:hypothetical protein
MRRYGPGVRQRETPAQRYCTGHRSTGWHDSRRSSNAKVTGAETRPAISVDPKGQVWPVAHNCPTYKEERSKANSKTFVLLHGAWRVLRSRASLRDRTVANEGDADGTPVHRDVEVCHCDGSVDLVECFDEDRAVGEHQQGTESVGRTGRHR